MKTGHKIPIAFFCALAMVSCGGLKEGQVPKIYQAWGARYQYDLEKRRMTSKYEDRKVGRVIGRDQWGRVDYDKYWVMKPFKGENLLKFHEAELDSQREARWEKANRDSIEARKIELSQVVTNQDGNEDDNSDPEEVPVSDDIFIPAPFLPQGIEINEGMDGEQNSAPVLPVIDNSPPPFLNEPVPDAPSPFAPLPPL